MIFERLQKPFLKLPSCFLKYDLKKNKTIMCFHPTLLCFYNGGFEWPALFSQCDRVIVSLVRLWNTFGTVLVLFLYIPGLHLGFFLVRNLAERKTDIFWY